MRKVGIRELKNRLSEYLRSVAAGETILITDHGRPVAELVTPGSRVPDLFSNSALPNLQARIENGTMSPPTSLGRDWLLPPEGGGLRFTAGTAASLIDELRGE